MFLCLILFIEILHGLNNGLGRTPQMGEHFHHNISEKLVQKTTDALIATGLTKVGYEYGMFFHHYLSPNPFASYSESGWWVAVTSR